ncbi:hypothetical protein [Schlesneria sp. DSM 10557]|uniref:hypothetical protein n=1 Tax=Schlesneria sp. DSM 10557 TaxID=3044399 RepID=UPI00359F8DE9
MDRDSFHRLCLTFVMVVCSVVPSLGQNQENVDPSYLVGMISLIAREPVLRELQIEPDSDELLRIRLLLKSFPVTLKQRINFPAQEDRKQPRTPQEVFADVESEYVEQLKVLLTPSQYDRLRQIHWQRWGFQALHDAELREALELTAEQVDGLNSLHNLFETQKRDLESQRDALQDRGGDISDVRASLRKITKDRDRAYDDVLTADQRIRFTELKGRPFKLSRPETATKPEPPVIAQSRSRGILFLIGKEPVEVELGIENDYPLVAKLRALAKQYASHLNEVRRKSRGEEQNWRQELESKLYDKYVVDLKTMLTANQFERLQQIYWQQLGNEALNEKEVASALEITADQQQSIEELNQELVKKVRMLIGLPGRNAGAADLADRLKQEILATKQELDEQVLQVLTTSQRDLFEQLKGKPFDLDQLKSRLVNDPKAFPSK